MKTGIDWSDVPTSQGTLRIAGHRQLGEKHGTGPPSEPPAGTNSANDLILNFLPLEL